MLQAIRERASGLIAYIIIGLLVITFALWGIHSYFNRPETNDVAQIGDGKISIEAFRQALQAQRQRFPQVDTELLKNRVLEQLVNEELLAQAAKKQGLRIGDEQLGQAIRSLNIFQQDGVFNVDRYRQLLRAQGYPEAAFEENLRRSLALEQLRNGLIISAITTPAELNSAIALLNQQRDIQYVTLALDNYAKKVTVDDAAIQSYYEENKDRLLKPEQAQVEYVELKLDKVADQLTPSEEDLQTAYQAQKDKFIQPEERNASHILWPITPETSEADAEKIKERAAAVQTEIASGAKTFDQALEEAKSADNAQGGDLGKITKGLYEDPAFENALFELKAVGDISPPVKTSFGYHIIRLDGIIPEKGKSFDEVKDELARDWRQRQAEGRFYDLSEKLANTIYEHADTLEPAARLLGMEVNVSPWFSRQGGEGVAAYPPVVEAAFSDDVLKRGVNSSLLEVEPNHVVVIRLKDHKEATPRSLEEARQDIETELRNRQAQELLDKDIESLRQRVEKGESLEALAGEFGGELKKPGLVGRRDVGKADPAVLKEAFRLFKPEGDKPAVGVARLPQGQAVLLITRIVPGDSGKMQEAERKALIQQLTTQIGIAEYQGFLDSLRRQIPVVIHQDRL